MLGKQGARVWGGDAVARDRGMGGLICQTRIKCRRGGEGS